MSPKRRQNESKLAALDRDHTAVKRATMVSKAAKIVASQGKGAGGQKKSQKQHRGSGKAQALAKKKESSKKKAGGLSMLLNPAEGDDAAQKSSQPTWEVKVYLPNTDGMKIEVFEICTVEEAIKTTLQQHKP